MPGGARAPLRRGSKSPAQQEEEGDFPFWELLLCSALGELILQMLRALPKWEELSHNGVFPRVPRRSLPELPPGARSQDEEGELLPALVCLCLGVANRSHCATMMAEMPRTQTMER